MIPQIRGLQFEILLEHVIRSRGYGSVLRNVEYRRTYEIARQVDVSFFAPDGAFAIIEAKYTKNPTLGLRTTPVGWKGSNRESRDVVIECVERRNFVRADRVYLATNAVFTDAVRQTAREHDVRLLDGYSIAMLAGIPQNRLNLAIAAIDIEHYNKHTGILYVPNARSAGVARSQTTHVYIA